MIWSEFNGDHRSCSSWEYFNVQVYKKWLMLHHLYQAAYIYVKKALVDVPQNKIICSPRDQEQEHQRPHGAGRWGGGRGPTETDQQTVVLSLCEARSHHWCVGHKTSVSPLLYIFEPKPTTLSETDLRSSVAFVFLLVKMDLFVFEKCFLVNLANHCTSTCWPSQIALIGQHVALLHRLCRVSVADNPYVSECNHRTA